MIIDTFVTYASLFVLLLSLLLSVKTLLKSLATLRNSNIEFDQNDCFYEVLNKTKVFLNVKLVVYSSRTNKQTLLFSRLKQWFTLRVKKRFSGVQTFFCQLLLNLYYQPLKKFTCELKMQFLYNCWILFLMRS